ncbi:hypothetical protein LINPERHAP1_LOCUS39549 [Linum perenne]
MDGWIPEAGRSRVLLEDDFVWLTIRGIPIHLRSSELFKQLGESCGCFIRAEDGDSLSSIRVCVKLRGSLPEEIPLFFGNVVFPLRVETDSVVLGARRVKDGIGGCGALSKGKEVIAPRNLWSEPEPGALLGGSSSAGCSSSALVSMVGAAPAASQKNPVQSLSLGPKYEVSDEAGSRRSERVKVDVGNRASGLSVCSVPSSALSSKGRSLYVGFWLDRNENLVCSYHPPPPPPPPPLF